MNRLPRRLRLVFGLSGPSDPDQAEQVAQMQDFVAYAADCRIFGELRLQPGRFTDLLNAHEEFELVNVQLQSLADGHVVAEPLVLLPRHELIAVHAGGLGGQAARRTHTRARRVMFQSDPYMIWGDIHSLPGSDPIASFQHRPPMVPLTDSRIAYELNGILGQFELGTLIVNRELADSIELAPGEGAQPRRLPAGDPGPLANDVTGDLVGFNDEH